MALMNYISAFHVVIKLMSLVLKLPVTWPSMANHCVTFNYPYFTHLILTCNSFNWVFKLINLVL